MGHGGLGGCWRADAQTLSRRASATLIWIKPAGGPAKSAGLPGAGELERAGKRR
jgi:hypothetical protein